MVKCKSSSVEIIIQPFSVNQIGRKNGIALQQPDTEVCNRQNPDLSYNFHNNLFRGYKSQPDLDLGLIEFMRKMQLVMILLIMIHLVGVGVIIVRPAIGVDHILGFFLCI